MFTKALPVPASCPRARTRSWPRPRPFRFARSSAAFWPDARPYRRWIPVGLVLIAIGAAIETAAIWMFKLVVDEVLVPGDLEPLVWIVAL
jgi:hypothetical protein